MYEVLTEINSPAGFLDISSYFKNGINFYDKTLKTIYNRLTAHYDYMYDEEEYETTQKVKYIASKTKFEWDWWTNHYTVNVPPYDFTEVAS